MLHFSIDGTIAYRQGVETIPGWEFELDAQFSEDATQRIGVSSLNRLQQRFSGDLNVERLPAGNMRISRKITAHGPESAFRQANDLRSAFNRYLGLRLSVARAV